MVPVPPEAKVEDVMVPGVAPEQMVSAPPIVPAVNTGFTVMVEMEVAVQVVVAVPVTV